MPQGKTGRVKVFLPIAAVTPSTKQATAAVMPAVVEDQLAAPAVVRQVVVRNMATRQTPAHTTYGIAESVGTAAEESAPLLAVHHGATSEA